MSTKNILTGVVAALALVLVLVVILVKTGVFNGEERTTEQEMIVETSMMVVTGTDADGNDFQYTVPVSYTRPKYSTFHTYPKKPTTTKETTEASTTQGFVVESSAVQMTDPSGVPVTGEDGQPLTELVTYTVPVTEPTTAPPTTKYVQSTSSVIVTDRWGHTSLDENGNPVTEIVGIGPPVPTEGDIWSESAEPGTTSRFEIPNAAPERNQTLAQAIVDQVNVNRYNGGLVPLEVSGELKTDAEMNCMSLALPNVYGESTVSGAYTFKTEYGGNSLYNNAVAPVIADKAMSEGVSKIGVGVVEYNDMYYTTVIFG